MDELSREDRERLKKISSKIDKRLVELDKELITIKMQMLLGKIQVFFLKVWQWILAQKPMRFKLMDLQKENKELNSTVLKLENEIWLRDKYPHEWWDHLQEEE